jgi:hypothetical protein
MHFYPHAFRVASGEGAFTLLAGGASERQGWVSDLERCCGGRGRAGEGSGEGVGGGDGVAAGADTDADSASGEGKGDGDGDGDGEALMYASVVDTRTLTDAAGRRWESLSLHCNTHCNGGGRGAGGRLALPNTH